MAVFASEKPKFIKLSRFHLVRGKKKGIFASERLWGIGVAYVNVFMYLCGLSLARGGATPEVGPMAVILKKLKDKNRYEEFCTGT